MKRSDGFTLLELVVVLGIFAVLSLMAYGGLDSVLTTRAHVARSLERTAALQKAYVRMRNDFQQLRARPVRDGYGEVQPALIAQDRLTVEFTRGGWRNPLSHPRANLERVAYRVDDDRRLVRESWTVLDRAQTSKAVETVLLDKVDELHWRFLDASLAWHDAWPPLGLAGSAAPETTPRAVEMTLELADVGEVRLLFSATNAALAAAPGGTARP